ncbi:hypothetical protein EMIT0196P_90264 [Pseudomonas chlororaphis]
MPAAWIIRALLLSDSMRLAWGARSFRHLEDVIHLTPQRRRTAVAGPAFRPQHFVKGAGSALQYLIQHSAPAHGLVNINHD